MNSIWVSANRKVTARYHPWPWAKVVAYLSALLLSSAVMSLAFAQATKPINDLPLVQLGIGDEVNFQVFGQPDMTSTLNITDNGTVTIPLAGSVKISGLSLTEAAEQLDKALRDGNYLVNPHVTLTVTQTRSQRVSVLGEVRLPGRYTIDSSTTIFDLLAQAGGVTVDGSDTIFILRQDNGALKRYPIQLRGFDNTNFEIPEENLRAGDSVFIPKAEQYYIVGEITNPGTFKLTSGMTILQAIAKAGGIGVRGSMSRIEVKRRVNDKKVKTFSANLTDTVQADDVIRIKESLF